MLPGGGSTTDRRPSAADVFGLESGSRSAPPHGARAEDEDAGDEGIGRPFQFQHRESLPPSLLPNPSSFALENLGLLTRLLRYGTAEMHVGLEDLSALPPEWITQLKVRSHSLPLASRKSKC